MPAPDAQMLPTHAPRRADPDRAHGAALAELCWARCAGRLAPAIAQALAARLARDPAATRVAAEVARAFAALEAAGARLPLPEAGAARRAARRAGDALTQAHAAQARVKNAQRLPFRLAAAVAVVAMLLMVGVTAWQPAPGDGPPALVAAEKPRLPGAATPSGNRPAPLAPTALAATLVAELAPVFELVATGALAEYRIAPAAVSVLTRIEPGGMLPAAPHVVMFQTLPDVVTVPAGSAAIFKKPLAGVTVHVEPGAAAYFLGSVSGNFVGGDRALVAFFAGFSGSVELGRDARLLARALGGSCRLGAGSRLVCTGTVSGPLAVPARGVAAIAGNFRSQATVAEAGTLVIRGEGRGGLTLSERSQAFVGGGWRGGVTGPASATLTLPQPAPWLAGGPFTLRITPQAFEQAWSQASTFRAP